MFLVIERVEFSEAFPVFAELGSKRSKEAMRREPTICHGIEALCDKLDQMDHLFRRAIVLEPAQMAARIPNCLNRHRGGVAVAHAPPLNAMDVTRPEGSAS